MKSRALRPTPAGVLEARAEARGEGFRFDSASDASFASDVALSGIQAELPGIHGDLRGLSGAPGLSGASAWAPRSRASPACTPKAPRNDDDLVEVQVLGRVAAGLPVFAEEHVIDTVRIDRGLLRGGREVFGPPRPGRLDDRGGHPERRLHLRAQAAHREPRGHRGRPHRGRCHREILFPEKTTYAFSRPTKRWRPSWCARWISAPPCSLAWWSVCSAPVSLSRSRA